MRTQRNIYKRKDGRWEGRYFKEYDSKGKIKYGSVYAKTYYEVKVKLKNIVPDFLKNPEKKIDIDFKDVCYEWLENKKRNIKQSFYAKYSFEIERYNQCTNANQFNIESNWEYYSNPDEVHDRGYVSYTITYDLNKKYNNFIFSLTVNEIAAGSVELSILGDNSLIYGNGVSKGTNQTPVSINVKDVDIITFELTAPTTKPG